MSDADGGTGRANRTEAATRYDPDISFVVVLTSALRGEWKRVCAAGLVLAAALATAVPSPADALVALPSPPDVVSRPELLARPARVRPLPGPTTGWFGERRGSRGHAGVDFDGEVGDAVVAAAAGTVTWAGAAPAGMSGYGTVVIVDHGLGIETISAHLSSVAVAAGDLVWPGQPVGAVGLTGQVTGSHLHFELRRSGVPVDPAPWLDEVPVSRVHTVR